MGQCPLDVPGVRVPISTFNQSSSPLKNFLGVWLGSTGGSPQTVQHWGLRSEDSAPTPATHRLDSFFNGLLAGVESNA